MIKKSKEKIKKPMGRNMQAGDGREEKEISQSSSVPPFSPSADWAIGGGGGGGDGDIRTSQQRSSCPFRRRQS